jgi:adenylosuccinate lyase
MAEDDDSSYVSPLSSRYASPEMSFIFSPRFKYTTWRRLWVALAKAEKALGLSITDAQIQELEAHLEDLNLKRAEELEKETHHDVMAHILAYAELCPRAKPIIHLGATSCYVTDNGDLIQFREAMRLLKSKLTKLLRQLASFAEQYAALPTLSFTHYQPAQPTTVGKRACLWLQDFLIDFHDLQARQSDLRFLGVKGATGTQSSFLALFEQDAGKVKRLEELVAEKMGFESYFTIASQTYPRKVDVRLMAVLSGIAISAHKCATDLRLLANLREIEEPFAKSQVGSSAMPYKRNPMRCERICALARFLISLSENPAYTAATQWLERTLDDSANRRLYFPEAFLTADALLTLLIEVSAHLSVHPKVIQRHLQQELPFLATENILMASVKKGNDRQLVHEALRKYSREAYLKMIEEGTACDLLEKIARDPVFSLSKGELEKLIDIDHFIGRSKSQVEEFLKEEVDPILISQ